MRKTSNLQEERTDQILLLLKKHDYLSTVQIHRLLNFGSLRNTQRILKNMSEYLSVAKEKEHVYYLNKEGRERIDSEKVMKKTSRLQHFLVRNNLFIFLGCPATWKNEMRIKDATTNTNLICDSMFIQNKKHHFVEIDLTQNMKENKEKIKKYQELKKAGDFQLIWVTTTDYRRKKILSLCSELDIVVYLERDLK